MYAIVNVGSKQYNVKPGDIIQVEKIKGTPGKSLSLNKVMLISDEDKLEIGTPFIKGAEVTAEFIADIKSRKTISYKYRRRKSWHTKKGHRQLLSRLEIKKIRLSEAKV